MGETRRVTTELSHSCPVRATRNIPSGLEIRTGCAISPAPKSATVLRNLDGVDDVQARWAPDGRLISLIGVVSHLNHVEWRWIDGGFSGADLVGARTSFTRGPRSLSGLRSGLTQNERR